MELNNRKEDKMITQKQLIRLARITYKKMQGNSSKMIRTSLKNDDWWNSLSGTLHQQIGKVIAKYHDYFVVNCEVDINHKYIRTDHWGNGIYS